MLCSTYVVFVEKAAEAVGSDCVQNFKILPEPDYDFMSGAPPWERDPWNKNIEEETS